MPPLSHLTSYTPTKSNLYPANSLAAAESEPSIYGLLTFQVSNIMSLLRCLLVRTKVPVQVRGFLCEKFRKKICFYGEHLAQPPSWSTTSCRLSTTAYSIYSQLPSTLEAVPFIRNLRTRHAVVTETHLSRRVAIYFIYSYACLFLSAHILYATL